MILIICFILLFLFASFVFLLFVFLKLTKGICNCNTYLLGKTAIITGGNSGIGYTVALNLAGRGCKVIIADIADAENTIKEIIETTGNPNVTYKYLNLASFASVRKFAQNINESEDRLDILINNAGSGLFTSKQTEDECDFGMQVNHFGSFLLTHLLTDLLKKSAPSRIIFTSSWLSFLNNLTPENLNNPSIAYIYRNSKACNIITADGFAKRLKGTGVTSNSVHPGLVNTSIFSKIDAEIVDNNIINIISKILYTTILPFFGKTPVEGAQTIIHLALSKTLENTTGTFFSDCVPFYFRPSVTKNSKVCSKIWELSEELVKLKPNEKL